MHEYLTDNVLFAQRLFSLFVRILCVFFFLSLSLLHIFCDSMSGEGERINYAHSYGWIKAQLPHSIQYYTHNFADFLSFILFLFFRFWFYPPLSSFFFCLIFVCAHVSWSSANIYRFCFNIFPLLMLRYINPISLFFLYRKFFQQNISVIQNI